MCQDWAGYLTGTDGRKIVIKPSLTPFLKELQEAGLGMEVVNGLARRQIDTWPKLREMTPADVGDLRNMGPTRIALLYFSVRHTGRQFTSQAWEAFET